MVEIMIDKPAIVVDFDEPGIVTWHSCGWRDDSALLAAAGYAIQNADTPEEVITNLSVTFRVILTTCALGEC